MRKIRPEINAVYGDIEEVCREVNGGEILADPSRNKPVGGMTVSRKIITEFEEKKKIPKTSDYYKKLLESFERRP